MPAHLPGFWYQLQPPRGAAKEGESEDVSGQRLNTNDFRMIIAGYDTEKLGGYQEKKVGVRSKGHFPGAGWAKNGPAPEYPGTGPQ
jgi:hypothetical protein